MALPSNITLTPDSFLESELPSSVSISGTDIFERPHTTDSELFTQTGDSINLYGTWTVDNSSPTGSETFNVQDIDTYSRTESQLVDPRPNKFLGVSLWFKRDSTGASNDNSTLLRLTGTAANGYKDLIDIGGFYTNSAGIDVNFFGTAGYSTHARVFTATNAIAANTWYHLYCYLDDPSDSASLPHLFINGVEVTHYQAKSANWDYHEPFRQDIGGSSILSGSPNMSYVGSSISDVYVSTQPDFVNQLNAYYTNTSIPTSSYDELLEFRSAATGDLPLSQYGGGAGQSDGIIGKSYDGSGTASYIDATTKLPNFNTGFKGFSLWYKVPYTTSISGTDTVFSISDSSNSAVHAMKVTMTNAYIYFTTSLGLTWKQNRVPRPWTPYDKWHHLFFYHDSSVDSNPIKVWLNGVEQTNNTTNDLFTAEPSNQDIFEIGVDRRPTGTLSRYNYYIGELCDFYWSTDSAFKDQVDKYYNQPTILVGTTDVTPTNYISTDVIDITIPSLVDGTYPIDITNSSGTGSTQLTVGDTSVNITINTSSSIIILRSRLMTSHISVLVPSSIVQLKTANCEILTHVVSNDRLINLRNFLPVSFDGSEVSDFVGFFEDFLNYDLFQHKKDGPASTTDVGILKKIELLFTLRDPDLIDEKFIQYFASQLGYNINYSRGDIANITGGTTDRDINGYLRNTIQQLPHWYKFKSTNNAIIMLMYSFGIVSDILTLWTDDYDNSWKSESPRFEQDGVNPGALPDGYYPTPHYKIVVNDTKTPNGWQNNLTNIIELVESIKPINTVFEGFAVKVFIDGIDPETDEENFGFDTTEVISTPVINSIKIGTSTMLNTQTP